MPNIKSAIKRVETNKKKNAENRPILTAVKNSIKTINSYIDTNNIEDAEKYLPTLMSVLDSAVAKGIIHRNNASNKISAISQRISDVKNGKKVVEIKKDNKTIAAEKAKAAKLAREEAKKAKAEVVEEKAE